MKKFEYRSLLISSVSLIIAKLNRALVSTYRECLVESSLRGLEAKIEQLIGPTISLSTLGTTLDELLSSLRSSRLALPPYGFKSSLENLISYMKVIYDAKGEISPKKEYGLALTASFQTSSFARFFVFYELLAETRTLLLFMEEEITYEKLLMINPSITRFKHVAERLLEYIGYLRPPGPDAEGEKEQEDENIPDFVFHMNTILDHFAEAEKVVISYKTTKYLLLYLYEFLRICENYAHCLNAVLSRYSGNIEEPTNDARGLDLDEMLGVLDYYMQAEPFGHFLHWIDVTIHFSISRLVSFMQSTILRMKLQREDEDFKKRVLDQLNTIPNESLEEGDYDDNFLHETLQRIISGSLHTTTKAPYSAETLLLLNRLVYILRLRKAKKRGATFRPQELDRKVTVGYSSYSQSHITCDFDIMPKDIIDFDDILRTDRDITEHDTVEDILLLWGENVPFPCDGMGYEEICTAFYSLLEESKLLEASHVSVDTMRYLSKPTNVPYFVNFLPYPPKSLPILMQQFALLKV